MLTYLFNRLKEPSTMAGLAAIAYVAQHAPSVIAAATNPGQLVMGGLGILAVLMQEGGAASPPPVKL